MAKFINEYKPDRASHPGETLEEMLEEQGISMADMAGHLGCPVQTVSDIIHCHAAITDELARQLEHEFPLVPASFWIAMQRNYDEFAGRKQVRRAA
ncbi:MAG: HigA family addiction module antitoxin [Candidatus Sumerlaeota bacterium]|nr:HigA family addiction module antitoxin [Candidatus Sumerlaeota bacterium]